MPLNIQNDVANSGIIAGNPTQFAGMTASVLPTGAALARRGENKFVPPLLSASGLNQKLGTRFDDYTYYSN